MGRWARKTYLRPFPSAPNEGNASGKADRHSGPGEEGVITSLLKTGLPNYLNPPDSVLNNDETTVGSLTGCQVIPPRDPTHRGPSPTPNTEPPKWQCICQRSGIPGPTIGRKKRRASHIAGHSVTPRSPIGTWTVHICRRWTKAIYYCIHVPGAA